MGPHQTTRRAPEALHCYRHPYREDAGLLLALRPGPSHVCLHDQAPVGVRCPECSGSARDPRPGAGPPTRRGRDHVPIATIVLVAINVLVFLAEWPRACW